MDDKAKPEEGFTDRWFFVPRNNLYRAQVDQAMGRVYRLFLDHASQIQIITGVRNKNDVPLPENQLDEEPTYYIASRGIQDFITWAQYRTYALEKYAGLKIIGLGSLLAIAEFFGERDLNPGNFGF